MRSEVHMGGISLLCPAIMYKWTGGTETSLGLVDGDLGPQTFSHM